MVLGIIENVLNRTAKQIKKKDVALYGFPFFILQAIYSLKSTLWTFGSLSPVTLLILFPQI